MNNENRAVVTTGRRRHRRGSRGVNCHVAKLKKKKKKEKRPSSVKTVGVSLWQWVHIPSMNHPTTHSVTKESQRVQKRHQRIPQRPRQPHGTCHQMPLLFLFIKVISSHPATGSRNVRYCHQRIPKNPKGSSRIPVNTKEPPFQRLVCCCF